VDDRARRRGARQHPVRPERLHVEVHELVDYQSPTSPTTTLTGSLFGEGVDDPRKMQKL
jgi:hypothetical protein